MPSTSTLQLDPKKRRLSLRQACTLPLVTFIQDLGTIIQISSHLKEKSILGIT